MGEHRLDVETSGADLIWSCFIPADRPLVVCGSRRARPCNTNILRQRRAIWGRWFARPLRLAWLGKVLCRPTAQGAIHLEPLNIDRAAWVLKESTRRPSNAFVPRNRGRHVALLREAYASPPPPSRGTRCGNRAALPEMLSSPLSRARRPELLPRPRRMELHALGRARVRQRHASFTQVSSTCSTTTSSPSGIFVADVRKGHSPDRTRALIYLCGALGR